MGTDSLNLSVALRSEIVSDRWISLTTLNIYRQCPLKLFFRKNNVPARRNVPQVIGVAVHKILEELAGIIAACDEPVTCRLEVIRRLSAYTNSNPEHWSKWPYDRVIVRQSDLDSHIGFLFERLDQWTNSRQYKGTNARKIQIEHRVSDNALNLVGVVDYLEIKEDSILIRDYKTGLMNNDDIAESTKDQLLLYAHMVALEYPQHAISLEVVATRTGERVSVSLNRLRLHELLEEIQNLNESLQGKCWIDLKFEANAEKCADCTFRHACPKFWGLVDREYTQMYQEVESVDWTSNIFRNRDGETGCCEVLIDSASSIGPRFSTLTGRLRNDNGPEVLISFKNIDHPHAQTYKSGDMVRILDGFIDPYDSSRINLKKHSQIWDCASIKSLF
jgi:CRISPR/Cas system-associated exonuclease Cas4 (RecB family)